MTKRIQKAIDILLDAYNENRLEANDCEACAVGNLVAYGLPKDLDENLYLKLNYKWSDLFHTFMMEQQINKGALRDPFVVKSIEATDFTWEELAKIEFAFESTFHKYNIIDRKSKKESQLKALEEVVKVMMSFDEIEEKIEEVFTSKVKVFK